jgi:hypothetical protein
MCPIKGIWDIILVKNFKPNRVTKLSVIFDDFVDYIPGVYLSFITSKNIIDMFLQSVIELSRSQIFETVRYLSSTNKCMSSYFLWILLSQCHQMVTFFPFISPASFFNRGPLHLISRSYGIEVCDSYVLVFKFFKSFGFECGPNISRFG